MKLVTISIPTYNSEYYLEKCLRSIAKQSYKNIEINIIDGYSKDKTLAIAKKYKVNKIIYSKGSLMRARCDGVGISKGYFTLLLDSDQVLLSDTVEKCVHIFEEKKSDMLILEEDVYSNKTLLEKLFHLDRKLVHSVKDFDPATSVLLPRFYKTSFLKEVYARIPKKIIDNSMPQDHAILYLESWKISKKIEMVENAVLHIEPKNLKDLWRKFYRWGYYSTGVKKNKYDTYFQKKTERFRKGMFSKGKFGASLASILLLLLKGVPYKFGYFTGIIKYKWNKFVN